MAAHYPYSFRRWLGRGLLITLTVSTLTALYLKLTSWSPLWRVLLTSYIIGFGVFLALIVSFWVLRPKPQQERYFYFGSVVVGATLGFVVNMLVRFTAGELHHLLFEAPLDLVLTYGLMLMGAMVVGSILWARDRATRMEAAFNLEQAKRAEQERNLLTARLQMLQAQIEPHFLFNTLANVMSLIDLAPGQAKIMLDHFNSYLRASLDRTRDSHTTLGQELEQLQHYLAILGIRMGKRLRYQVEAPPELLQQALPPMLLQPLVENAIVHGLEPKVDGGAITIRAWREQDRLHLRVSDDGLGLGHTPPGNGIGLANVRSRLDGLYGDAARLSIAEAPTGGVIADIVLPIEDN
ncbi:histidine kinase [Chitinivorax sp. PXF-14]|uniref:sensor histidine kinase n=1 Tax=Chitinivorax sp. PXF-14 TaxID=3230488 RepID=UPI00346747F0